MFTIEQINQTSKKVKSGADFPRLIQDFKTIGIFSYISHVADGQTEYIGDNNLTVKNEANYPSLKINTISSIIKLKQVLFIHQQRQINYPTFCKQAAEAGVVKWITHIEEMTVTYVEKDGNILLVETIPIP